MIVGDGYYIVRRMTEDDVDDLLNLLTSLPRSEKEFFHPHPFNLQTLIEICSATKDHYFVMELNGKIIGYAFLRLFWYKIPSYGCCIRKEYQGKGYGTLLTQEMMNKAKELNYHKVILKVYKDNKVALRIYENIGFRIIGETDDKKQYKMEISLSF